MKTKLYFVFALAACAGIAVFKFGAGSSRANPQDLGPDGPYHSIASAAAVSTPVRDFAPIAPTSPTEAPAVITNGADPGSQPPLTTGEGESSLADFAGGTMPPPSLSFDGLTNFNNLAIYNLLILPPDTIGDVGPDHYVQAVNSLARVYDKAGVPLTPPFRLSDLFAPLNTVCSSRNDGDPSVLYDPLADRWIISQYCTAFPPFRQMVAVSQTGDPTGAYYLYEFVMPNMKLNDFPKLAVWHDGYYMSTDEFVGSDYAGAGAFAFDRAKMLEGDASAGYIYFSIPSLSTTRFGGLLASDLDGLTPPPPGAPNTFASYDADEYGQPADAIRLYDFRADFAAPQSSTFTERPESPLSVAAFDPTSTAGRADIRQPAPGEWLDSQSDRLMYRLAYRNLGTHDALVVNQTVRVSPPGAEYRAGVRVYELRRTGSAFAVHENATVGTTDASRWIGSAAMDHEGNIAVGYNKVTDDKEPAIIYSGRTAAAPPGTFLAERELVDGTGVQKAFGYRWGDYSGMTVDPADDCTFWITGEYFTQESEDFSDFTWLTRIGKFKFDECSPAPRSSVVGVVTNSLSGQPVPGATITATAYSRRTGTAGTYGLRLLPGTYAVRASAPGYSPQMVNVSAADGQTVTQNFALVPIPVPQTQSTELISESCRINNAAEPGEAVTLNVALRNTGNLATLDLSAELMRSPGVTNPGPAQSFGALVPGGAAITRAFTFTVSPNIQCGRVVELRFRLSDAGSPLGFLTVPLQTGEPRYAMRENFDAVSAPGLPTGWTSSASGAQQPWTTSTNRTISAPNSAYSPDPNQVGVNELVSPVFPVMTAGAKLSFENWYELETTFLRNRRYDGSVLEIRIGGGEWQDILDAGGQFETGGYDGPIDACCQNPLAGRNAWSGRSGVNQTAEFITTRASLPAAAAGQNVQLRFRVATDLGTFREGQYIDDLAVSDGFTCGCVPAAANRAIFDFDGDAKTDLSVFRAADAPGEPDFFIRSSSADVQIDAAWGAVGDLPANADFDGDGRTDLAVFRPSERAWYVLRSADNSWFAVPFGLAGDRLVPADYDGDAKADIAVFRPSTGVWYILRSSDSLVTAYQFGLAGDLPVQADHDGDGKADIAVFRPSTGTWYVARSSNGQFSVVPFGLDGDVPVPADFDADGETDIAVFRPSTGTWYLLRSKLGFAGYQFGLAGDRPLQADFDGDGMADIAVFRPSTGAWYYLNSSTGTASAIQYGQAGDTAVPGIFTAP